MAATSFQRRLHGRVTNGDSFPAGISVHSFVDDGNQTYTWFIMRTGQSWGGSTAFNMVTTLEKDTGQ